MKKIVENLEGNINRNSKEVDCESHIFHCYPISLIVQDFSEIKKSLDDMKKTTNPDFRERLNADSEQVLTLSDKVKFSAANDAALKLYQAENLDSLNNYIRLVFNKMSYEVFREELIALYEGKTTFNSETVIRTIGGKEIDALLKLVVPTFYENSLSKVFVSIMDISDMHQKMKELDESEEKYRRIFETANDAIFLVDTETGIILEVNHKAEELTGLSLDNIMGMNFTELYPKEEAAYYRGFLKRIIKTASFSENTVVFHKSGKKIPVVMSGSILMLREKKLIACIFREIPSDGMVKSGVPLIQKDISNTDLKKLTNRETEVLMLIASGLSNKQIANRLFLSIKTIETHRARIMEKLSIHKTADLVRLAMTLGLLKSKPSDQLFV